MPDLTELQRLAEEATSGPWNANEDGVATTVNGRYRVILSSNMYDTRRAKDSAFVAAMSPDTAKKLIAVARAARENMGALEEATGYVMDGIRSPSLASEHRAAVAALRTALEELKK